MVNKGDLLNAIEKAYKESNNTFGILISKLNNDEDASIRMWNMKNFTKDELIKTIDSEYTWDLQNFGAVSTKIIAYATGCCYEEVMIALQ